MLGISKRTLQKWLQQGKIPIPEKAMNGYYRWSSEDFTAAMAYKSRLQFETNYHFGDRS